MRIAPLILFSVATLGSEAAAVQSQPAASEEAASRETLEEVIVRGRRLSELKIEMEQARIRAYDIFNDINSHDDFDVYCRDESRSGTRVPQQVCRARFEGRISSDAGQEYLASVRWRCRDHGGLTVECLFDDRSAGAISAAQGVEAEAPIRRRQLTQEIERLARENLEFAEAIVEWYEAGLRYDEARRRPRREP